MARQIGEVKITGTIDGICFYKMHDQYCVRMKSSLTGKRFRKDRAFEGSRRSCERLAEGSKIASVVYQEIAKGKKTYPLYCRLKHDAIMLLKEGVESEIILQRLRDTLENKKTRRGNSAQRISASAIKLKLANRHTHQIPSLITLPPIRYFSKVPMLPDD